MKTYISFENLGTVNKNRVDIGELTIWFSYRTPVAYSFKGEFFCRQNEWSTTTGKLLNELESDKSKRIPGTDFENKLNNLVGVLLK